MVKFKVPKHIERGIMDTVTIEEASSSLRELISKINEDQTPCKITDNNQTVIVFPEQKYHDLLLTLEFLSTPGLLKRLET